MGNEESFESSLPHPRFSKVQYSASRSSMLIRQPIHSKTQQISPWLQRQRLHKHIYTSPFLLLCKDHKLQQTSTCSQSCIFVGHYQGIYPQSLKQEIQARALNNRTFTEEQIWYFILFITKRAHEIYQNGDSHIIGNIHPSNVLLDRRGNYKLIISNYSYSLPGLNEHFREYQINGDTHAYISPQLIGFLYSTKYPEYPNFPRCVNKRSAEAFCFGLTVLAMATLDQQMGKVYKRYGRNKKAQFRMSQSTSLRSNTSIQIGKGTGRQESDHLDSLLNQVKKLYSRTLYDLIINLTLADPEKRSHADQVYSVILKPIERNILIFDSQWLETTKEEQPQPQPNSLKTICQDWARELSYIVKEAQSKIDTQ